MCTIFASARYRHSVAELRSVKALHRIAPTGKAESGNGKAKLRAEKASQGKAWTGNGKA